MPYSLICFLQPCGHMMGNGLPLGTHSCVFVNFPYGVLVQVWYLIVSIPDLCILFLLGGKVQGQIYLKHMLVWVVRQSLFTIFDKGCSHLAVSPI